MSQGAEMKRIIDVEHECVDGWHTFTSPQIPGLLVTGDDANLEATYNDLPAVIEALIFMDYGRKVRAERQETYDEYVKSLPDSHRPRREHYAIEDLAA